MVSIYIYTMILTISGIPPAFKYSHAYRYYIHYSVLRFDSIYDKTRKYIFLNNLFNVGFRTHYIKSLLVKYVFNAILFWNFLQ